MRCARSDSSTLRGGRSRRNDRSIDRVRCEEGKATMTKRFSRQHAFWGGLFALAAMQAGTAAAQPVCLAPPNHAPREGADGAPRWLSTDTHGGTQVKWLNDIRWSDAARM